MQAATNHLCLVQAITNLPFSESFLLRCKLMGFDTIQEIIETKEKELIAHEDFNYIWFNELLDYLNRYDLLYLMEDKRIF